VHVVDCLVERRRARRKSHGTDAGKPLGIQIIGTFNVEGRRSVLAARLHEPPCVVRVPPTHHDDGVHTADEIEEGPLPKLCGLTHRIDEPNVGPGFCRRMQAQTSATTSGGMVVWQTTPSLG